jgi:hypothetical protein
MVFSINKNSLYTMKKLNLPSGTTGLLTAIFLFLFVACSKKDEIKPVPKGLLSFSLNVSLNSRIVGSDLKSVSVDNFNVVVFKADGAIAKSFEKASDVGTLELEEGSYYIVAHSNNNLVAAFDNPYYRGQSDPFSIVGGETTNVGVTCKLANIMVTVTYAQSVIDDFASYSTTVSNLSQNLIFGMNETRAGYFNEGPLSIAVQLNYVDGSGSAKTVSLSGQINPAVSGRHYELKVEAALGDGYGNINLVVDETYETEVVVVSEILDGGNGSGGDGGDDGGDDLPTINHPLLFTEVMYNPADMEDNLGEYFELYNTTNESINLNGLVFRKATATTFHVISADVIVEPGNYVVLARSSSACENVDYVYPSVSLLNSAGDDLIIGRYGTNGLDGEILSRFDYTGAGFLKTLTGKSLQLSGNKLNSVDALLPSSWCASTTVYNITDMGTPGLANTDCN